MLRARSTEDGCKNCRYWSKREQSAIETTAVGWCHRYPPSFFTQYRPAATGGSEVRTVSDFPPTPESEWCGEWMPSDAS